MLKTLLVLCLFFVCSVARADYIHVVSTYTTKFAYGGKNKNRAENIARAVSLINGRTIEPNGTFSFNSVVGARTRDNGFKKAHVIVNAQLVDGFGGGACQVASTLHAAALYAGLNIVESHVHSLASAYIQPGLDATVSYPTLDLKIKNGFEFPVTVLAEVVVPGILSVTFLAPQDSPIAVRVEFKTRITQLRRVVSLEVADIQHGIIDQAGSDALNVKRMVTITYIATGELLMDDTSFFDFKSLDKIVRVPVTFLKRHERAKKA